MTLKSGLMADMQCTWALGIYGGNVLRDGKTGDIIIGQQYQNHNPKPGEECVCFWIDSTRGRSRLLY